MRFWIAVALMHLAAAYVVLAAPWLGARAYRRLKARLAEGAADARLRHYRTVLLRQAVTAAIVALIWLTGAIPVQRLGLTVPGEEWTVFTAEILGALALSIVVFRRTGDSMLKLLLRSAGALVPRSAEERRWFATVAVGAGVSEELMFRGFLFYYVATFVPGAGPPAVALLTSAVFGCCHLYQGWRGVLLTGLMGLIFASVYASSGCLWLTMAIHAAVDLRIPAILTTRRLQSLGVEREGG